MTPQDRTGWKWNLPPYVLVRQAKDGSWSFEGRDAGNNVVEHSQRPFWSKAGAHRAAKRIAAARNWRVVVLPVTATAR